MSKGINELHYETTIEECTKLGGVVISKSSITTLIVTLGDQGVLLLQKGQTKGQHFAVTPEENVVSVIMIQCIDTPHLGCVLTKITKYLVFFCHTNFLKKYHNYS